MLALVPATLLLLARAAAAQGPPITTTDPLGQTIVVSLSTDLAGGVEATTLTTLTGIPPVTTTVVNAAGAGVVEVISTNAAGVPVTNILSTITPNTVPLGQTTPGGGVNGAPPATPGSAPPTTYTYTTTDANGVTVAATDVFTPTIAPGLAPITMQSASVMAYSDYTKAVGTNTVAVHRSGAVRAFDVPRALVGGLIAVAVGAVGGSWLVLA